MIYALTSYSVIANKALGERCFQASFDKVKKLLELDPVDTEFEALIIGPKDISRLIANSINEAINNRNENIKVIYIYQTEEEEFLVKAHDVFRYKIERPTPSDLKEIIDEVISGNHKKKLLNALFGFEQGKKQNKEKKFDLGLIFKPEEIEETAAICEEKSVTRTLEDEIARCSSFKDWDYFKRPLNKESIYTELIIENTQFSEAIRILESKERLIINTFKDPNISSEEKFRIIKEIGIDKSGQRATANNILVEKFIKTVLEVVSLTKSTVDSQLAVIKSAIDQMQKAAVMHCEKEKLENLIQERMEIQMKLLDLSREVIEIFKNIDSSAEEIIDEFDQNLPSQNKYINEIMKPFKRYFIPQNSAYLANRLLKDLQTEKLVMGQVEAKIMSMVSLLFKLCESDETIIDYQSKLIKLLTAQKVEDIVVVDTILKNSLRLYVGGTDVGRTATCVTICKVLSRRNNTLLIDLTGADKFADYGINAVSLDKFMKERPENQFVCVAGNGIEIEDIDRFIGELKLRLNYYPYINIILDVAQEELIKRLSESALAINFITNCTTRGIALIKKCLTRYDIENIARKIILIDPQIEISEIISAIGADMLMYKIITIPYLAQIKACSLKKVNPAEIEEISIIFDEIF